MNQPDGTYAPEVDGSPDPGEIVWAWVPYEEDPHQGKDRPVLVICTATGSDGQPVVRCLVMTSKDHDRDEAQEASAGRFWMDVGTGAWDPRGRPSEVRLNRLPLLIGRTRMSLTRQELDAPFSGATSVSRDGFGLDDFTGQLRLGAALAPLPVGSVDLDDVSVHFANGVCESAEGRVRALIARDVGGFSFSSGLSGTARCQGGKLRLPLTSQGGAERLDLILGADGRMGRALVRAVEGQFHDGVDAAPPRFLGGRGPGGDPVTTTPASNGNGGTRFHYTNEYDLPGIETVDGVVEMGGMRTAWFNDSEGNIIALGERT